MPDLAARVFYKAHFDIVRENDSVDLLKDVIVKTLSDWLVYKYKAKVKYWNWAQFAEYGFFDIDSHQLIANSTSFIDQDGSRYWACKIEEFEAARIDEEGDAFVLRNRAPRIWTTEVGFEQVSEGKATISYVVYYADKAGFIGCLDEAPSINTPGFIRQLIYCGSKPFHCMIGENCLSPIPVALQIGKADEFAGIIKNPQRKVPVILFIPPVQEDIPVFPAKQLAKSIMGNAIIYEATDSCISEELTFFLDRSYWCMPGQIRIYWPEGNNATRRNRYLSAEDIDSIGFDGVIDIFRRVLATDIRYYEAKEMFRIEDCNELFRQSRIRTLKNQYQEIQNSFVAAQSQGEHLQEQVEIINQMLELADSENQDMQNKINTLEDKLNEARQDLWRVKALNEHLNSSQEHARSVEKSLESIRNCNHMPNTPIAVAEYFAHVFSDTIDFSERGYRSLSSCITKTEILWECFYAMATSLISLYRKDTPGIENAFRLATGLDMARGEGSQTRSNPNLMALRNDQYQGRDIVIEPHVRKGNRDTSSDSVRIYFCYDRISDKIIIGHVGGHLDNHTSLNV